ncbi:MAG: ribonuclease P protein component [Candidatus Zixiibacteriota bacterium]|nr:MAG: ribonuclease P protein component [candidate division Zixibacteria bacterium]
MSRSSTRGDRSFGRSHRLKGRNNFLEAVRGEESSKVQGEYCSISFTGSQESSAKFGISVSRKVGVAVKRNRLKRVIREFLRNNKSLWPKGGRIVISLSNPVDDENSLTTEIGEILSGIDE